MIDAQVGVLLFPQYTPTLKGTGNIMHRVFILDSYRNAGHTRSGQILSLIWWCVLAACDYFIQMSKRVASKQSFYCFWSSHSLTDLES